MFAIGCAAVGMRVTLVDDFRDPVNQAHNDSVLDIHRSWGVEVVRRDVIEEGLGLPATCVDAITAFDVMEHWHHSPKTLFHGCTASLVADGLFVLATPNCANLRKRVLMPVGRVKWSSMADWYEQSRFRGHVREPDVGDLRYIASDLQLAGVEILGRNWAGLRSASGGRRAVARAVDRALQLRPQLCSDIYMVGRSASSSRS